MKRLILLLVFSPAILAQPRKDPNDEPFLPIHPVYPYNPKLIKREAGAAELAPQLTPELYAPKVDAKESYSFSYGNSYQRNSYYPDYPNNFYPRPEPPSYPPSYNYNGEPTAYPTVDPYAYNPYSNPSVNPADPSGSTYPVYYYQPSYYYPHYFTQALFPPPPPASSSSEMTGYHETASQDAPAEAETTDAQEDKDDKRTEPPAKVSETTQDTSSTGHFVDGGNYISGGSRDLDVQSSTYKVGPYNQLEREVPAKSNLPIPLPKTTYRVISVAGQPVGPDYPLPASYVKAQQVEQQTLARLLAQKTQRENAGQSYENSRDLGVNDPSYVNQDAYDTSPTAYVTSVPDARSKPVVTYVINADTAGTANVNEERPSVQGSLEGSSSQRSPGKNVKYVHYSRKAVSSDAYAPRGHRDSVISNGRQQQPPPVDQTDDYGVYGGSQGYGGNNGQSYGPYHSQSNSYRNKDVAVVAPTPRSYINQYSAYESEQQQQQQQQQPYSQDTRINDSDDGNFGAKQYNKG